MTDGIPPAETWPSYGELRSCQKFCFTACQEGNSSALSHTSHPDQSCKTPSIEFSSGDPQAYRGLIEELKCSEIPCICRYDKWLKSVQKLYDCGAAFCQTGIGTPALPDVDFSQSINVLTGFCSKQGYQHLEEFQLDVGKNYTGMGPSDSSNGLTRGDVIAITTSTIIGGIALLATIAMLFLQIKTYRVALIKASSAASRTNRDKSVVQSADGDRSHERINDPSSPDRLDNERSENLNDGNNSAGPPRNIVEKGESSSGSSRGTRRLEPKI